MPYSGETLSSTSVFFLAPPDAAFHSLSLLEAISCLFGSTEQNGVWLLCYRTLGLFLLLAHLSHGEVAIEIYMEEALIQEKKGISNRQSQPA